MFNRLEICHSDKKIFLLINIISDWTYNPTTDWWIVLT